MILSTEKYYVKQGDQYKNVKIYISMHANSSYYLTVLFWGKRGSWAEKEAIEYNIDCKHFFSASKNEVMKDADNFLKKSLCLEDYQLVEE